MKRSRILFSLLMAIVMMAMSPQRVWADGTKPSSGDGSTGNPYQIASKENLIWFRDAVNGVNTGTGTGVSICGKLTANITSLGTWTPIGNSSKIYTGTFDGQGHVISGMNLNTSTANAGLFGYVNGATIKNLTLSASAVTASCDGVGSVVGRANGASHILDVKSNTDIAIIGKRSKIGGIVGYLSGSSEVSGCVYTGVLDAGDTYDCIGGIVGFADGASFTGSITFCFCNGTFKVKGTANKMQLYIGGILGYLNDENSKKPVIQYNFSDAQYKRSTDNSTLSDSYFINAIIGRIRKTAANVKYNHFITTQYITQPINTYETDASTDESNTGITISVTTDGGGSVTHSYDNPTSTKPTQLYVKATPNTITHHHFDSWSDEGAQEHNVNLDKNVNLIAKFAIDQYTITVATNSSTMGTVSGGGTYDWNSKQTIKATAKTHYHFAKWSDGNKNASRTITVTGDATYTATFAPNPYTITVNVASGQSDMGTVSGGDTYDYGTQQTITATPKTGYHFVKWSDDNTDATRTIIVTGAATYTATFAPNPYTITVNVASGQSDMGTVEGGDTYDYGTQQTIKATANEHYHFVQWNDGDTNASRTITVTENKTYTATFAIDQHTITVKANNDNYGTVNTTGGTYNYGTQQTITATPKTGYHFVKWSDDNTDATRTIIVTGDATYTATFAPNPYTITVTANNSDYGTVSGGGTFDYNSTKTITATPNAGYYFVRWNDGNTDNPRTITVSEDMDYNAYFVWPKAVFDQKNTLTFYCDAESHEGNNFNLITGYDRNWSSKWNIITSVVFDESFKIAHPTTCNSWFQDFVILSEITGLEYLNTDSVTDMSYMFDNCKNLKSLDLSHFKTEKVKDMRNMFSNCIALTSLDLSSFNTEKVENMNLMFGNCIALTSLNLKSFDTSSVKGMAQMFYNCNVLKSIDLSGFNTSSVERLDGIFAYCSSLTSLDLSSFNTSNLQGTQRMFQNCSSLKSLDLSNFNTSNVIDVTQMFSNCSSLTSLDLSSFDTSGVRYFASIFAGCSALEELIIDNFDMQPPVVTNANMFNGCTKLDTLTMKSVPFLADGTFNTQFTGPGKTVNVILDEHSKIYEGTNYLPEITNCNHYGLWGDDHTCTVCGHAADVAHTGTSGTCTWTIYEGGLMIVEPTEGETGTLAEWTEWDGSPWYAYHDEITSVKIRGEVIASTCFYFFVNCRNLITVDLKGLNTGSCDNMANMFNSCSSLQSLDLSSINTASVTDMSGMFAGCSSLQSLDLSSFNTAKVKDMIKLFYGCSSLKTLNLSSSFDMREVHDCYNMFDDCDQLDTLNVKGLPFLDRGFFDFFGEGKNVCYELNDSCHFYHPIANLFLPKATEVKFAHDFTDPDQMYPFMLPFTIPVSELSDLGKFYQYNIHVAYRDGKWVLTDIYFSELNKDQVLELEANTPYLFAPYVGIDTLIIHNAVPMVPASIVSHNRVLNCNYQQIDAPEGARLFINTRGFAKTEKGDKLPPFSIYIDPDFAEQYEVVDDIVPAHWDYDLEPNYKNVDPKAVADVILNDHIKPEHILRYDVNYDYSITLNDLVQLINIRKQNADQ